MNEQEKKQRTLVGRVVSNKMDKTISVLIERKFKHPLFKKYVRKSSIPSSGVARQVLYTNPSMRIGSTKELLSLDNRTV